MAGGSHLLLWRLQPLLGAASGRWVGRAIGEPAGGEGPVRSGKRSAGDAGNEFSASVDRGGGEEVGVRTGEGEGVREREGVSENMSTGANKVMDCKRRDEITSVCLRNL